MGFEFPVHYRVTINRMVRAKLVVYREVDQVVCQEVDQVVWQEVDRTVWAYQGCPLWAG